MSSFDRLSPQQPITDANGLPTVQFQAYYQQFIDKLNATVLTLQGQISTLTAQQALLNTTSTQASAAYHAAVGGAQEFSQLGSASITSSGWTPCATVSFPAAVAATVTFPASGITSPGSMSASSFTGECRVVQVIAGVDTVLQVEAFTCTRGTAGEPNTVSQTIFSYSGASAATGVVGYRLDARSTGSGSITSASFLLDVIRT